MITLKGSLPDGTHSKAEIKVSPDVKVEAIYHKCPETGNVTLEVEDHDEVPHGQTVTLTLFDHDAVGNHSEYTGRFDESGQLVPVG